jgi:hypothetical protein
VLNASSRVGALGCTPKHSGVRLDTAKVWFWRVQAYRPARLVTRSVGAASGLVSQRRSRRDVAGFVELQVPAPLERLGSAAKGQAQGQLRKIVPGGLQSAARNVLLVRTSY